MKARQCRYARPLLTAHVNRTALLCFFIYFSVFDIIDRQNCEYLFSLNFVSPTTIGHVDDIDDIGTDDEDAKKPCPVVCVILLYH